MATRVIFKKEGKRGDVCAFFPAIAGNMNPQTMACYAHIGQHSAADRGYMAECKPATPDEYADLLRELQAVGYDDLLIARRATRRDYVERRRQVSR